MDAFAGEGRDSQGNPGSPVIAAEMAASGRKADPYRPETVWYKIKSRTYTQGEGRRELFQKRT